MNVTFMHAFFLPEDTSKDSKMSGFILSYATKAGIIISRLFKVHRKKTIPANSQPRTYNAWLTSSTLKKGFATMPQYVSRSRKLFSAISLIAVCSALLPLQAISQSSYVTDYGKKKSGATATTASTTTATATTTTTATTKTGDTDKKSKTLVIVKPTKHVNPGGNKWNEFADYIILKPGQENYPLTMTVTNGADGTAPLRAIRATLAGRALFNEKSFKGNRVLTVDMSGALGPGSTQIIFNTFGAAQSAFTWDLTSKTSPTITGLNPKAASPGKTVTAQGKLLPLDVRSYTITVGGKPATVSNATVDGVNFRVPDGLKPDSKGEATVVVSIAGSKQKPMQLKIALDPEITSFSHVSIAGSQGMTITGKNFGKDASAVKVTFGGVAGIVNSVSDTSISVITPDIQDIPSRKEVQIEVNGLKCKQPGMLYFSMRNVENSDGYSPFSVPSQFD